MKVDIIDYPDNLLKLVYTRARTCYSELYPSDIFNTDVSEESMLKLINRLIRAGHTSVLEKDFTIAIEGISRACSLQLVRHRLASFSQKSQRYVEEKEFKYIKPKSVQTLENILEKTDTPELIQFDVLGNKINCSFDVLMSIIQQAYSSLIKNGIKAEDARSVLPNCCETNLTMTLNIREFIHICNVRLCTRAQGEITDLVKIIKNKIIERDSWLQPYLQPMCEEYGFCKEIQSCGRKPVLNS